MSPRAAARIVAVLLWIKAAGFSAFLLYLAVTRDIHPMLAAALEVGGLAVATIGAYVGGRVWRRK